MAVLEHKERSVVSRMRFHQRNLPENRGALVAPCCNVERADLRAANEPGKILLEREKRPLRCPHVPLLPLSLDVAVPRAIHGTTRSSGQAGGWRSPDPLCTGTRR